MALAHAPAGPAQAARAEAGFQLRALRAGGLSPGAADRVEVAYATSDRSHAGGDTRAFGRCSAGLKVAEREVPAQVAMQQAVPRIGREPRFQEGAARV